MILVVGGRAQGKKDFAKKLLKEQCSERENKWGLNECLWMDGEGATWDEFVKGCYCCNLPLFVRRLMEKDLSLKAPSDWMTEEKQWEERLKDLSRLLAKGGPKKVIVADEIGNGIVPLDPFQRQYRELTGRLCCLLAQEADQVWRVCCGLGKRIR